MEKCDVDIKCAAILHQEGDCITFDNTAVDAVSGKRD
jgi:hypothetical protein